MRRHSLERSLFLNSSLLSIKISPAPYFRKTWCIIALAMVVANLSLSRTNTIYFENMQTAVSMYAWPLVEVGKGRTRSHAHRSTGAPSTIGSRRPCLGGGSALTILAAPYTITAVPVDVLPPFIPIQMSPNVHMCFECTQLLYYTAVHQT